MPGPATISYPRLESSAEFERLATDIASRLWRLRFQRHGRSGQRQHGVDAFARTADGRLIGLQHKNTKTLKRAALEEAIREAEAFDPPLGELVVMTAAKRDSALQRHALQITQARLAAGRFEVTVLFWDDLCDELGGHPELVAKYFPVQLGAVPPVGLERARAWVHKVVNVWIEALDESARFLARGNLTWRHHTERPESVWGLMRCVPDIPAMEDLLGERADLARLVVNYDQLLGAANEAVSAAARELSTNPSFRTAVAACLEAYNLGREQRDAPWGSHDECALPLLVAEHIVNREQVLPANRTDTAFWANFGARLRSEFEHGVAVAASRAKVEELAAQCENLRWTLEKERSAYCSKFGIAAC